VTHVCFIFICQAYTVIQSSLQQVKINYKSKRIFCTMVSVGDPDQQDPHVLGFPDLGPDPLVRGADPDPAQAPDPFFFSLMCRAD
jgi:hypothetical protein